MLALVSLIISLSALVVASLLYWKARRKNKITSEKLSNRVGNLLSEFNEVSSSKVELLEEKTDQLRRVVELADLKIDKLDQLVDHATGARKQLEGEIDSAADKTAGASGKSRREKVLALAEQGFSVEEIARKLDLKRGEVDVIVKFNRSRLAER